MKIAPSILNADQSSLQSEMDSIASADRIHLDIMDGEYVPRKIFTADDFADLEFPVETEAHLMCARPEEWFDSFVSLGVSGITIHTETQSPARTQLLLQSLKDNGIRAGVCVDGFTDPSEITDEVLALADQILVMSVKAGKGGQSFMPESLDKIRSLRTRGFTGEIEVDGGVNLDNVTSLSKAGADIVVVGSFLMKKSPVERVEIIERFQKT